MIGSYEPEQLHHNEDHQEPEKYDDGYFCRSHSAFSHSEFRGSVITPEEADLIKQRRLEKMRGILEEQGFTVTEPEAGE